MRFASSITARRLVLREQFVGGRECELCVGSENDGRTRIGADLISGERNALRVDEASEVRAIIVAM